MHICNRCTRSFKRKQEFDRHIMNRQVLCKKPTHYCGKCSKGFASATSLWRHKQRCNGRDDVSSIGTPEDDTSSEVSMGTMNNVINNTRYPANHPKKTKTPSSTTH